MALGAKMILETVRLAILGFVGVLMLLGAGMFAQQWWATEWWGIPYASPMSFKLVASFMVAGAVAIFWAAWTRDWAGLVGVGIDTFTIGFPAGVYALRAKATGMHGLGRELLVLAAAGLAAAVICWPFEFKDRRWTPRLVYASFVLFVLLLLVFGIGMVSGRADILPWENPPAANVIYGWMYIGAAAYFIYGLVRPCRSNATGQLAAFLAYDLVLIVPFIQYFKDVPPHLRVNLIGYLAVIVYSGIVAAWYLIAGNAGHHRIAVMLADQRP